MADFQFQSSVLLRHQSPEVFEFVARAENLNLQTPPWVHFSILSPLPINMGAGTIIDYRIRLRGIPVRWVSEITEWDPPFGFEDTQKRGPYLRWVHRHIFEEVPEGTLAIDDVAYRVPGGRIVNRLFVAGELKRIFSYRKARLLELFP